eukprot:Opistho-2@60714
MAAVSAIMSAASSAVTFGEPYVLARGGGAVGRVVGAAPHSDKDNVVVTLQGVGVHVYRVSDQKNVAGWSTRGDLNLTHHAVQSAGGRTFYAARDGNVLLSWASDVSDIEKAAAKAQMRDTIVAIVPHSGDDGACVFLANGESLVFEKGAAAAPGARARQAPSVGGRVRAVHVTGDAVAAAWIGGGDHPGVTVELYVVGESASLARLVRLAPPAHVTPLAPDVLSWAFDAVSQRACVWYAGGLLGVYDVPPQTHAAAPLSPRLTVVLGAIAPPVGTHGHVGNGVAPKGKTPKKGERAADASSAPLLDTLFAFDGTYVAVGGILRADIALFEAKAGPVVAVVDTTYGTLQGLARVAPSEAAESQVPRMLLRSPRDPGLFIAAVGGAALVCPLHCERMTLSHAMGRMRLTQHLAGSAPASGGQKTHDGRGASAQPWPTHAPAPQIATGAAVLAPPSADPADWSARVAAEAAEEEEVLRRLSHPGETPDLASFSALFASFMSSRKASARSELPVTPPLQSQAHVTVSAVDAESASKPLKRKARKQQQAAAGAGAGGDADAVPREAADKGDKGDKDKRTGGRVGPNQQRPAGAAAVPGTPTVRSAPLPNEGARLSHRFVVCVCERILGEKRFFAASELRQLLGSGCVSARDLPTLIPRLLELGELGLFGTALSRVHDVPDQTLVECIRHFVHADPDVLSAKIAEIEADRQRRKKNLTRMTVKETDPPMDPFLCAIVSAPRNDVFLQDALRELTMDETLALLQFLFRWAERYATKRTHKLKRRVFIRIPTFAEILDWCSVVLDARFVDFVLVGGAHPAMSSLAELVSGQRALCEGMQGLKGQLSQLLARAGDTHGAKAQDEARDIGIYGVELLVI